MVWRTRGKKSDLPSKVYVSEKRNNVYRKMSLVAYGASDSEASDSEEIEKSVVSKSTDADNEISDEEDYKPTRYDQTSRASSSTPTTRTGTSYLQCEQNPLTLSG